MARAVDDLPELATPSQVLQVLPITKGRLRELIRARRIGYVQIGRGYLIPRAAVRQFIDENTVQPCPEETTDLAFASSKSAAAITSHGPNEAAAASARLARQTANRLKSRSPISCNSEAATPARVIPLKCS